MKIEDYILNINKEVDSYNNKLHVTICFGHTMIFDQEKKVIPEGSFYWPGRKMTRADINDVNNEVTPDIVIQSESGHGVVSEIKTGLAKDQKHWDKIRQQLKSYDDHLAGWYDVDIVNHDIVLLIPYYLHVEFKDFLTHSNWKFERNVAYVSFTRDDGAKSFMSFQKFAGKLQDINKDKMLYSVNRVPMDMVLPDSPTQFCDDKPCVAYTMEIVWSYIAYYKKIERPKDKKSEMISFTLGTLVADLKNANTVRHHDNDERAREVPRAAWIREALDAFVRLKIFTKSRKEDRYFISYSKYDRIKKPLDTIIKMLAEDNYKQTKAKREPRQLSLFE